MNEIVPKTQIANVTYILTIYYWGFRLRISELIVEDICLLINTIIWTPKYLIVNKLHKLNIVVKKNL